MNGGGGPVWSADGNELFFIGTTTEVHIVLNWFEELERLVPTNP